MKAIMKRLLRDEEAQALPLALIALVVGALLVGSFLSYATTNLIASRVFSRLVTEQYAADAGVEEATWNLLYGNLTTTVLSSPGDSVTYSPTESVNGLLANVTVTRRQSFIASDNFESGGWSGGLGWLNDWYYEGDAIVQQSPSTYEGNYHLRLRAATGYVKRAVDLLDKVNVHLQFWAKAWSLEPGETADFLVSSNGTDWTVVNTWQDGDDDNVYRFYDVDLSPYTLSGQFWIAFEANMSDVTDYLYVDDLSVRPVPAGAMLSPSDAFESGDWAGGLGWLGDWVHQGDTRITKKQDPIGPYEGLYHMEIRNWDGYASRAADLSGQSGLRLQFRARVRTFEPGDEVYCLISSDGSQWTTVKTWTSADSDNTYHFYDIDLSPYTMSSEFWIAFSSGMNAKNDYFYVDDLTILGGGAGVGPGAAAYEIVSVAASITTTTVVLIEGSEMAVLSWVIE